MMSYCLLSRELFLGVKEMIVGGTSLIEHFSFRSIVLHSMDFPIDQFSCRLTVADDLTLETGTKSFFLGAAPRILFVLSGIDRRLIINP